MSGLSQWLVHNLFTVWISQSVIVQGHIMGKDFRNALATPSPQENTFSIVSEGIEPSFQTNIIGWLYPSTKINWLSGRVLTKWKMLFNEKKDATKWASKTQRPPPLLKSSHLVPCAGYYQPKPTIYTVSSISSTEGSNYYLTSSPYSLLAEANHLHS
jgi:hypothetical protein